jgi:ornithine cyclodeaminase/alanine dehydrogenase-like protein (mu-crystallin family)
MDAQSPDLGEVREALECIVGDADRAGAIIDRIRDHIKKAPPQKDRFTYTHPETGFPPAICDGSYHTVMRTGAAAAVSAKWMGRKNSKRLAIVGAGHMAGGTLATCSEVFKWEDVRIWSRSQKTLDEFVASEQPKYPSLKISASRKLEEVVRGADVVVTVTPARARRSLAKSRAAARMMK